MTTAAIATLFNPMPAMAAPAPPALPAVPPVPAVPDSGSRPVPLGSLVLPGQTTSTPTTLPSGLATTPALAKIEKARADVALLGERLITLGEERDLAVQQAATAERRLVEAQTAVERARLAANTAASNAFKSAAALPPGTVGSNLHGLGALAGIQRGEPAGEEAAGRQLVLAEEAQKAALVESGAAATRSTDLSAQYTRLAGQHQREQAALQKLEQENATEIAAGEAIEQAQNAQLGAGYSGGDWDAGKAADPRALAALAYALDQRGDPYVWSEEGPDQFDCSGLMWAAYRTPAAGSYTQLPRVSRDQYRHTSDRAVDRYSLLPGDLLFFSSSNSWTGIHHVAMYAGKGMMVEAPRTGLDVRLAPVRWTRLFQATRVYGPIDGPSQLPDLGPDKAPPKPSPSASPTKTTLPPRPEPSTSTTKPNPGPSSSSPSTSPSPSPSPSTSQPSPTPSPTTSSSAPPVSPSTSASSSAASSAAPSSNSASASNTASTTASSAASSAAASKAAASASKAAG